MKREKLTLQWGGTSASVPDIIFDDYVELPAPVVELRAEHPAAPVAPVMRSIQREHYDSVKELMDRWAEWMMTGEPLAEGAPRQCLGAPDARIHSFEDMEIEVNKRIVREVQTAVWELSVMEREAVMMHYGLNTRGVWQTKFEQIFDMAVESLFGILKSRISC